MVASACSEASARSCRAERSVVGSMRMSSGASIEYENPRSGRSTCIDETPRSSRIASAWTSLAASWPRTVAKVPRRRRVETVVVALKRSNHSRAPGSRSIAISFPSPWRSWASRVEWPPAPKVPSTTVSPGFTASCSRTSSASTGTCSVELGKTFGNIFDPPFHLGALCLPRLAIPDLEVVVEACDDDVLADPGPLGEARRQDDPALLVQLGLRRRREVGAAHDLRLAADRVDLRDARAHGLLVLRRRVGLEAAVVIEGKDHAVAELGPELSRKREPVLVVDGVLVLAEKHGRSPSSVTTGPHFRPLLTTWQSQRPISGEGGRRAWRSDIQMSELGRGPPAGERCHELALANVPLHDSGREGETNDRRKRLVH